MKFPAFRPALALLAAGLLLATGCSKNDDDNGGGTPSYDGTVTWTYDGQTFTSTTYSSAIVDPGDRIVITGSSDLNTVVSLSLQGINAKGVGTYPLAKSTTLDPVPTAGLTVDAKSSAGGRLYSTDFSGGTSNGSIVVTQYDKAAQKLAGTFSFTAGPYASQGTGTVTVTNGSFSFTKFR